MDDAALASSAWKPLEGDQMTSLSPLSPPDAAGSGASTPPQTTLPPRQGSLASVQSISTGNPVEIYNQLSAGQAQSTATGSSTGSEAAVTSVARLQQSLQRLYGSLGHLHQGSRTSLPDIAEEKESGPLDLNAPRSLITSHSGGTTGGSSGVLLASSARAASEEDLFALDATSGTAATSFSRPSTAPAVQGNGAAYAQLASAPGPGESRTLFISGVNPAVDEDKLREYLMCFGDVHSLYTAAKHRGYIVVSYHDLRAASLARHTLHGQSWHGRQLECHQAAPGDTGEAPQPPATLLVASLDGGRSLENVFYVLSAYGELRDLKTHQTRPDICYAEYYDDRHAAAAISGIAASPESSSRLLAVEAGSPTAVQIEQGGTTASSALQASLAGRTSGVDLVGMARSLSQMSLESSGNEIGAGSMTTNMVPGALAGLSTGDLAALGNAGPTYPLRGIASTGSMWQAAASMGSSPPLPGGMWPTAQVVQDTLVAQQAATALLQQRQQQQQAAVAATLSQVQQQAAVQAALQQALLSSQANTAAALGFNAGTLPGTGPLDLGPGVGIIGGGLPRRGYSEPSLGGRLARRPMDPVAEQERRAQQERLYGLDLARIAAGEDKRTTLMIKNIPNKYTQKMLLTLLEERFAGVVPFPFDFFYLPIDFKNRCNVGYAFINMASPHAIPKLVEEFHGRRWPKFNSEKICRIAYARIQGRNALVQHFQNSSLLHEDKRCRPVLFGVNGEVETFPGLGILSPAGGLGLGMTIPGLS